MKTKCYLLLIFIITNSIYAQRAFPASEKDFNSGSALFIENKGQVSDQFNNHRPDVLFSGNKNGMVYHLRNDGISYQLSRIDSWKEIDDSKTSKKIKLPSQTTIYRLDVNWLNSNKNFTIVKDESIIGYNNYYLESCPDGILNVKSYTGITYKNIYANIDLHYYEKNGMLEYDYVVSPGGNYKKIQLQIDGAEKIELQKNGSVKFKTPLGFISQEAPIVYQKGKKLNSKWVLEKNILSFEIQEYEKNFPLLIDPVVRTWGTYYGGSGGELGKGTCIDSLGNVFLAGWAFSSSGTTIATLGAHQTVYGGSGDAFLAAFNSSGGRLWGTYYGGSDAVLGQACCSDGAGNIYMCGLLEPFSSSTVIATSGAHQTSFGGGSYDGFFVKFNSSGVRQWGTFYGGAGDDRAYSCSSDANGDVYLAGTSSSASGSVLATVSGHQTSGSGFLSKFTTNGVRIWGTYYTGSGYSCAVEGNSFVYLAGSFLNPNTASLISTPSSHQVASGGLNDAFLVKFNSTGVRQWGTCYGGSGQDYGNGCAVDLAGNVYLVGSTNTPTGTAIATAAAHQSVYAGGTGPDDGFLVQFNSSGIRQWGTYYGGTYSDIINSASTNSVGAVFICGTTRSNGTVIATSASHQTVNGTTATGYSDAFLVKFNSNGTRDWGTFYGGSDYDYGESCVSASSGNIYLAGSVGSSTGIATTGAHQTGIGGSSSNAMLIKFFDCSSANAPQNVTAINNLSLCSGSSTTLSATGLGSVNWFSTSTSTTVLNTGPTIITPTLNSGVVSYYAGAANCPPGTRTQISVTVNPTPLISASNGTICLGDSFTINPTGASTYSVSGGSFTVSPSSSTSYSITGTSSLGCVASNTAISNVLVNPLPTVSVNSGFICIGSSFQIIPSGASSYSITGNVFNVSPSSTTSYSVTGTSAVGCVSSNTAISTVTVNTVFPTVTINSGSICAGKSFTLIASGADTYVYSSGNTIVSPISNTNYTVTGTNLQTSCKSSAVSTVIVEALPVIVALTNPSTTCEGETATVSVSGAITYTWSSGINANTFTINPNANTSYSVEGTGTNGCTNKTTLTHLVDACTHINALGKGDDYTIFPNPTSCELTIKTSIEEGCRVELYNAIGQLILSKGLSAGANTINLNELSSGIYYAQIKSKEFIKVEKIIKE